MHATFFKCFRFLNFYGIPIMQERNREHNTSENVLGPYKNER